MSFYFVRTPRILQWLFNKVTWRIEHSNAVYLTFDDGPNPAVTIPLLKILKKNKARATFFLLGKNAEKYPELVQRIRKENHSIGFHCNEHLNSRKLNRVELFQNFKLSNSFPSTVLYRPPYGKLRLWQYNYLKNKFPLIGWTLMPGDFDANKKFEAQLENLKTAKCGDIVVLHELPQTITLLEAYFEQASSISFEKL